MNVEDKQSKLEQVERKRERLFYAFKVFVMYGNADYWTLFVFVLYSVAFLFVFFYFFGMTLAKILLNKFILKFHVLKGT